MYPRQSPTTHTEQLGDEASVYDWARGQVHALNPTAARVWRQCDGATSPRGDRGCTGARRWIPEAKAVVDLTLTELARLQLLELPADSLGDRPAQTRRWLLGRGVTAAMLPAIYSIVAPSPVDAQSVGAGAPTLTSLAPNQGSPGHDGAGDADRHQLRRWCDDGHRQQRRRDGEQRDREQRDGADRGHRDRGKRHDRRPHGDGDDGPRHQRRANLHGHCAAAAGHADADQRHAESRRPGRHGRGHADGHQFHLGATTVGGRRQRRDGQQHRRGQQHVADRQFRARGGRSCWRRYGDGHDGRRDQRAADFHGHSAGARARRR